MASDRTHRLTAAGATDDEGNTPDEKRIERNADRGREGRSSGIDLRRRSILKAAGAAALPLAASSAAAAESGYGAGGYGEGGYGGESDGNDGDGDDAADPPAVTTRAASDVDDSSATLSGELTDLGTADAADCYVEWREAGATSWTATDRLRLESTGTFDRTVSGLAADAGYEFRAVAETTDHVVAGDPLEFTTDAAESTPEPPSVDSLAADEDSPPNPHAEIDVEWSVSDPDGDLATVRVEVFGDGGAGSLVASWTENVDGSSDSGSGSTKIKKGAGETYLVTLTVTDAAGTEDSDEDLVLAA